MRAADRPCGVAAAPRRPSARPASARSLPALQRLVLQILVMKLVPELVTFRGEIAKVLRRRLRLDRHLLDDCDAEALDPHDLLRVVRQDSNRRQAELGEDLIADPVIAHVWREAELEIRVDGVEA